MARTVLLAQSTDPGAATFNPMTTAPSEPLSQRLAAIREQLTLLADYL
jgi:hypothetical protein